MRALVLSRYGGPEHTSLTDVPQPSPRAGEFLVRVHAAGLNPVDDKTRAGALRVIRKYPLPIVMGNELCGVVEAIGPGVTRFAEGDRVFARVAKDIMGAFAEYAVVHEDHAARMPASLDFPSAAAVPLAALTALQALRDELHLATAYSSWAAPEESELSRSRSPSTWVPTSRRRPRRAARRSSNGSAPMW